MTGNQPINEMSGDNPTTPYDANKLVSEHYCRIYNRIYGVRSCIVRFATVYGERQKINPALNWRPLVATMLREVLEKRKAIVGGDGNQTRDLIYVLDAVQGVIKAMESNSDNASVHLISTNTETSVLDVLRAIIDLTGINPEVEHVAPIPAEIRRVRLDYSKARQSFGFEPCYTLKDGLQRMLPYMVRA
jgi:UDP-glucose 4-epimerase